MTILLLLTLLFFELVHGPEALVSNASITHEPQPHALVTRVDFRREPVPTEPSEHFGVAVTAVSYFNFVIVAIQACLLDTKVIAELQDNVVAGWSCVAGQGFRLGRILYG